MKRSKNKKTVQKELVNNNISKFFSFLENRLYPAFDHKYIKEIKKLSQGFNIRLSKEQKLKFCKKCDTFWTPQTREIRFNSTLGTKEYICKNCGFSKKFKYR